MWRERVLRKIKYEVSLSEQNSASSNHRQSRQMYIGQQTSEWQLTSWPVCFFQSHRMPSLPSLDDLVYLGCLLAGDGSSFHSGNYFLCPQAAEE